MFFPKTEFCPFNKDEMPDCCYDNSSISSVLDSELSKSDTENMPEYDGKCEMMKKIQEMSFAIVDLNLFLDTHPDCEQALELFKKLSASLKSLKSDYQNQYGPLYATESSNQTPFSWVSDDNKWPWEF